MGKTEPTLPLASPTSLGAAADAPTHPPGGPRRVAGAVVSCIYDVAAEAKLSKTAPPLPEDQPGAKRTIYCQRIGGTMPPLAVNAPPPKHSSPPPTHPPTPPPGAGCLEQAVAPTHSPGGGAPREGAPTHWLRPPRGRGGQKSSLFRGLYMGSKPKFRPKWSKVRLTIFDFALFRLARSRRTPLRPQKTVTLCARSRCTERTNFRAERCAG